MENHYFSDLEHPVTESDLHQVEREFHFSFPRSLKQHYLKHNGGQSDHCLFPLGGDFCVISEFLPVKYGEDTIEAVLHDLRTNRHVIPEWLIPFAVDPGGDYYCFSSREQDLGSIYLFRGDYSEDLNQAVVYLAQSFSIFMKELKPEEEVLDSSEFSSIPQPPPERPRSQPKTDKKLLFEAAINVLRKSGKKIACPELLNAIDETGFFIEPPTEDDKITLFNVLMAETRRGDKSRVRLVSGGFRAVDPKK